MNRHQLEDLADGDIREFQYESLLSDTPFDESRVEEIATRASLTAPKRISKLSRLGSLPSAENQEPKNESR